MIWLSIGQIGSVATGILFWKLSEQTVRVFSFSGLGTQAAHSVKAGGERVQ